MVYQGGAGDIWFRYKDNSGNNIGYNYNTSQWASGDFTYPNSLNEYFYYEFHSDGTSFYLVLKDASGSTLITTTSVNWSSVKNNGSNYWFYIGDANTGYYWLDSDIDNIEMSYTAK